MVAYTERQAGSKLADFIGDHAQVLSIATFFALCVLFFGMLSPTFLNMGNLLNIVRQAAPIMVVAVAMTLVITTGGIDLSVGSMVALINASAAVLMAMGLPWPLAIVLMLVMGAVIGGVQGWFISYQGIPAFIVTLAGLSILRGAALYLTEGYSIPIRDADGFFWLGRGEILGLPVPALIAILIAIIGFIVMLRTQYGRQVIAVGSNMEAARRVGMPARKVLASVYVVVGLASAIAAILIAARLGSGSSNAAQGFELQVIAAVVLGGTSLLGGKASMFGTVLGTMTIAVIGNGLILLHISPFFTQIVTGTIILIAIWMNTRLFERNWRFGKRKKA
ncbi:ABC transporter permease [Rhodobacter sp. TJ_12]|uniref:ABC transporter permease n=1 Tax=Rhodobacter sp. TJ_12 TaxID=2029399 RepID=UPI001CBCE257|nr:ABC transporter permease [Rhodobacter sp. TJ_12]MBZ4021935.1 ABC transporter permease [Rhodobacter sp. TJ_12]